jgi:hypothetical protein
LAQPDATHKQQQQAAAQVGMLISAQGLEQRFTAAAVDFMKQLLEAGLTQLVCSEQARPLLPQFNGVYLTDCTRLAWGRVGSKLAVRWDLQRGQLQACLETLTQHDQTTAVVEQSMPAGALHLGDLGFFKLKRFARWNQQGVYWLTRFKLGTTLSQADGQPLDLLAYLQSAPHPESLPVRVGVHEQLPAYLVATRLPDDAYAQRLDRLREAARRDQRALSSRQVAFAGWTLYLTNIPDVTFAQAHLLARMRWQIELLFKLWKSHGNVLGARSTDPLRQQCEGYAKLLGVVVAHWLLLVTGWQHEALGALDALRLIRASTPLLMRALAQQSLWLLLVGWLREALANTQQLSKRRKVPLAFQLWRDFDLVLP